MNKEREKITYLEEKETRMSAKELYERLYPRKAVTNPIKAKFMVFLAAKRRLRKKQEGMI